MFWDPDLTFVSLGMYTVLKEITPMPKVGKPESIL